MHKCEYNGVSTVDDDGKHIEAKLSWTVFLRQVFISSGPWTAYFMLGLCTGAPTVIIPQIRKEANSTEAVSDTMAALLSTICVYSGIPWIVILALLARFVGRKIPSTIVGVIAVIGFTVFFWSTTLIQCMISEMILGITGASMLTTSIMVLTEYTAPRYRGVFLTMKSASFYWGMWVSNAIGTFFHWKIIGLVGIMCAIYTLVSALFWTESPHWLANVGKYEECARSHRWLKGNNVESKKELEALLQSRSQNQNEKYEYTRYFEILKSREYYMPMFCCFIVMSLYHFSGKLVCSVYAIQIIQKITDSESAAYTGMLILDGITVLGTYTGSALSKFFKRRLLLITTTSIAIFFLLSLSLYLYLVKLSLIMENNFVSIGLLLGFSIGISCGPIIMSTSITGELIPLQLRSISVCIVAIFTQLVMGAILNVSPFIFSHYGAHGAFLFYVISSSALLILIYIYLPETKDKTLQEILENFKVTSKSNEEKHAMEKNTNNN